MDRKETDRNPKTGVKKQEHTRSTAIFHSKAEAVAKARQMASEGASDSTLHEPQAAYQAHQAIRAGYPIQSAIDLESALDITNKETAELLGISPSTLARRKNKGGNLTKQESDKAYRVQRIARDALSLFEGDLEEARKWLKTPMEILGGDTPLAYCDTEAGAQFVRDLIGRLEHGVF